MSLRPRQRVFKEFVRRLGLEAHLEMPASWPERAFAWVRGMVGTKPLLEVYVCQALAIGACIDASLVVQRAGRGHADIFVHDHDGELHEFLGVNNPCHVGTVRTDNLVWRVAQALVDVELMFQAPAFEELGQESVTWRSLSDPPEMEEEEEEAGGLILPDQDWAFDGCGRFEAEVLMLCWGTFGDQRYGQKVLARPRTVLERWFRQRGTLLHWHTVEAIVLGEGS